MNEKKISQIIQQQKLNNDSDLRKNSARKQGKNKADVPAKKDDEPLVPNNDNQAFPDTPKE